MKHFGLVSVVLTVVVFSMLGSVEVWAEGLKVCVPQAANKPFQTPNTKGECANAATLKYKLVEVGKEGKEGPAGKEGPEGKPGVIGLSGSELEALKGILPYVKFFSSGVAGKPTVQFSGVNVQVVSGSGSTKGAVNSEGNLVIGYDENLAGRPQTGSNNLILGEEQEFTSFGGIVAGLHNATTAPFASVTAGELNVASGQSASVSGGRADTASGNLASVSGGVLNDGAGELDAISGGADNRAEFQAASVSGGFFNLANGLAASISGGQDNSAAFIASVSGGFGNRAYGAFSWIGGGENNEAGAEFEAIP